MPPTTAVGPGVLPLGRRGESFNDHLLSRHVRCDGRGRLGCRILPAVPCHSTVPRHPNLCRRDRGGRGPNVFAVRGGYPLRPERVPALRNEARGVRARGRCGSRQIDRQNRRGRRRAVGFLTRQRHAHPSEGGRRSIFAILVGGTHRAEDHATGPARSRGTWPGWRRAATRW